MIYVDKKYKFFEHFDSKTGKMVRSGIIKDKKMTEEDPFRRSYPSLLDIGIMGHCKNSNNCDVGCYQKKMNKPNMTLENFKKIIDESKGKVLTCSLGGSGSPNEHEDFEEIVKYSSENGICVSYTTSGIELTDKQIEATSKWCSAVAVSHYKKPFTSDAISRFLEAGCKTNIHYVLGNDSIDEAILRLRNDAFPKNINAVIFLLYKPVGCIKHGNMLTYNDPRVKEFFQLIEEEHPFKVGLDACCVPGVMNFSSKIDKKSIMSCDGAAFSSYITSDMFALPCSFDVTSKKYAVDLKTHTIKEAWESETFEKFRNFHRNSCPNCPDRKDCKGGCPLVNEINLCQRGERSAVYEEQSSDING